jgi:hypothetical protein
MGSERWKKFLSILPAPPAQWNAFAVLFHRGEIHLDLTSYWGRFCLFLLCALQDEKSRACLLCLQCVAILVFPVKDPRALGTPGRSFHKKPSYLWERSFDQALRSCAPRLLGAAPRHAGPVFPFCHPAKQTSSLFRTFGPRFFFDPHPFAGLFRFCDPLRSAAQGYGQHRKSAAARTRSAFRHGRSNRMSGQSRAW